MRAGSVTLEVDGQTSGTGLVLSLLAQQIAQYGSPDAVAQKTDDYLAALDPPQTRPRSEHDRDAELYRSAQEPSQNPLASALASYFQPKIAVAVDRGQSVDPATTSVFYAPAGSLSAPRTLTITYASGSLIDGDYLLVRNDSSQVLSISVQQYGAPILPPPVALTTVVAGGWIFAMQVLGTWRVLAGS